MLKDRTEKVIVLSMPNLEWSDHFVKIVDYSVIGIGIESDRPIDPGIISSGGTFMDKNVDS